MRSAALLVALILLPPVSVPDSKLEARGLNNHPFSVNFPSGNKLRLHLRSGDFRIAGRNDNKISVRLAVRNDVNAQDLTVRFERHSEDADLHIFGGPRNGIEVTVEVPTPSMLYVRMPAGDLTVDGISGDKDIELHAGDLSIAVGNAAEYGSVDASVLTGDLQAPPFHESHSGLFRSFEKHGPGKYKLHAHVGAGDLTLR
jgi:hypothetical protein